MREKFRSRRTSLTLLDLAAGIAVSAVAVPALAADMPTKAPAPIAAPAYNWTGFYVGAHAGYRWADADFTAAAYSFNPGTGTVNIPARSEGYNLNGGIVGLQVGYNYQFAPNWLIGIEGDWSWGRESANQSATITGIDASSDAFTLRRNSEVELTWQATIRGRVGFVNGPWMIYGTGGVAFARVEWTDSTTLNTTPPPTVTAANWSNDKTLTGWVAGAGFEYMFNPNWIARVEYLYESFGDFTVPHGFGPQYGTLDLSHIQKVRVGINYKFAR